MNRANISLIVATTPGGVIGREGKLPWRLPKDQEYFKKRTVGHSVIMGRKTRESIGRSLSDRTNIVVTRQEDYSADQAIIVLSPEGAIDAALRSPGADEIFVIGGAEIYKLFLPYASTVYRTEVYAPDAGDTCFPQLSRNWALRDTFPKRHLPGDEYPTSFQIFERVHLER